MSSYFRNNRVWLIVLTISVSSSQVFAAEVVLREQVTVGGPIVRLGDIADISASTKSILKGLSSTPLVPAPAPGSPLFLQRSHVRDLLASRGIDILGLQIRGAAVVQIGKSSQPPETDAPRVFSHQEIETLLRDSIKQHLQNETGHNQWRITLKLSPNAYHKIASWGQNLAVRGGRAPWTGRYRFQVRSMNSRGLDSDEEIEFQATVVKIQPVLFARQVIKKGDVIRAVDVEIRQHEGQVPRHAMSTLDQALGMEAKQTISENMILQENQLRAPLLVQRGETVTVVARTGGISVRTFAVARQDGAMGDLVQIETLDGKQRFAARVSGRHRLEVLAAGKQTVDYATLGRRPLRR